MSEASVTSEATALAAARSKQSRPNNYSDGLTRNRPPMKCTKCGLDNHTIKGCYEIIGYPEGWAHKGRKKDSTRASFKSAQSFEETASEPPSGTSGSKALAVSVVSSLDYDLLSVPQIIDSLNYTEGKVVLSGLDIRQQYEIESGTSCERR
ncbi:unnamed protein product [Prunus armeniaca]